MTPKNIIIVGAGIGGLSAALALLRKGHSVKVYEQSLELGEIGAGIMLTPNAVKCLNFLGLEKPLSELAVEPEHSVYRRFDTAQEMMRAPLKDKMSKTYGARYFHIHRADLHHMLLDAVLGRDPHAVSVEHALMGCEQDSGSVTAIFENGQTVTGDVLIGCDGIRSALRQSLFGAEEPRFTGQAAYRGMVPAEGLPATVTEPVSVSWLGEHKHIIQYGVRGRKYINYVAIVKTDEWTEEGWNRPADVDEVVETFTGWHEDVLALLRATPSNNCYRWGLFDREPIDQWTNGRVTLLGDAAHPTLPFMAQGSAMALEDAVILGHALSNHDSSQQGLLAYEDARRERTTWIVQQSRKATDLYQRLTGDKSQQRASNLDTVYGYDASTVSV